MDRFCFDPIGRSGPGKDLYCISQTELGIYTGNKMEPCPFITSEMLILCDTKNQLNSRLYSHPTCAYDLFNFQQTIPLPINCYNLENYGN